SALQLPPAGAAVGRLVQAASRPAELAVLPRSLARFPERGVDDLRILRIEDHVGRAGVRALVEHALEALAAVGAADAAALPAGSVGMAEHRHDEPSRRARVAGDLR